MKRLMVPRMSVCPETSERVFGRYFSTLRICQKWCRIGLGRLTNHGRLSSASTGRSATILFPLASVLFEVNWTDSRWWTIDVHIIIFEVRHLGRCLSSDISLTVDRVICCLFPVDHVCGKTRLLARTVMLGGPAILADVDIRLSSCRRESPPSVCSLSLPKQLRHRVHCAVRLPDRLHTSWT